MYIRDGCLMSNVTGYTMWSLSDKLASIYICNYFNVQILIPHSYWGFCRTNVFFFTYELESTLFFKEI